MWPIFGPAVSLLKWAVDSFEAAREIRLELVPGLVGYPDGSRVAFIILTVRNIGQTPQKVEGVALWLSNGEYLLLPMVHPALAPDEAVVTPTRPYETGFELDDVKARITAKEAETGRQIGVIGARVRLTSGRSVRLKKKIDVNNAALFRLRSAPGGKE